MDRQNQLIRQLRKGLHRELPGTAAAARLKADSSHSCLGRREGGRKVSLVFSFFWPPHTWSPWAGCVPLLKASVAIGGPLHRHIISVVQKLLFPFGPFGPQLVPPPSLNTAQASRNIPSSSAKCGRASSLAGSPASCLASPCLPFPDHQLCGAQHCCVPC